VLDAPGIAKEDLSLTVEEGVLTVRGSRKAPEVKDGCYTHNHRWAGEFVRTFRLGNGLDTSKVEANLKDGVLHITIAKSEVAKPREIAIQS
jgi:HSP20 family protein